MPLNFRRLFIRGDGARYVLAYVTVVLLIVFAVTQLGWARGWSTFQVSVCYPPSFCDMRTVQASIAAEKLGLDPLVANPTDPWKRVMNYPSIWLPIAKFFSLDDEAHYIAFVGIYCALYFLATALLLWRFPSIWLFLAATSNAALMVVERGNNDVIIFLLSLVASVLINPGPILLIVITATYLKIYPLVLIIGLRDRPVWFALGIAALSTILMLHYDDLSKIVAGTPVSSMISFGTKSIERMFAFNFMLNWLGRQVMWWEILLAHAAVVGLLAWRFKRHIQALPMHTEDFDGRLFVSGAAIYLFTFAFGGNFDYRLVFLVLCIPWLNRIGSTRVIQITLFSMLLAMYADLLQKLGPLGWLVAVIAKSEIFIVLGLLLLNVVFRAKAFRTFLSSVASVRPSR